MPSRAVTLDGEYGARLARLAQPGAAGAVPRFGAPIDDRRPDERFLIGTWHWLIVIYEFRETEDVVTVLSVESGSSAGGSLATS